MVMDGREYITLDNLVLLMFLGQLNKTVQKTNARTLNEKLHNQETFVLVANSMHCHNRILTTLNIN